MFPQVPSDVLSGLLADKAALTKVLLRHVVVGSNIFSKGIMWAVTETAGGESVATQVFRRGVVKVINKHSCRNPQFCILGCLGD